MKHLSSHGVRLGIAAVAAQLLMTACLPAALAQDGVPRRGEPITLNFSNAEIESVARTMAVITGRDVVVDPRVKGVVNLQTERAIAPAAAFNQFAAALRLQGFAVVQADGNVVVYGPTGPVWQTRTAGVDSSLEFSKDGTVRVVTGSGAVAWTAKPAAGAVGPYRLVMQTDGNLVEYDGHHRAVWSNR